MAGIIMPIAENLKRLQKNIRNAEQQYNREPRSVQLLAVSKKQSTEKITQAYQAGQTAFGENYCQEALEKIAALETLNIEWHFIGSIQSNKTAKIAEHFAWAHGVDSLKLAKRLSAQRPQDLPPLNVCIQINIDDEASKAGVAADGVLALAQAIKSLERIKLRGLMVIPRESGDPAQQLQTFKKVTALQQQLNSQGFNLDTLSMGMSGDYPEAIAAGSTLVRIGTALFGARN